MRWRLAGALVVGREVGKLFAKAGDFGAQPVELTPLGGDGLVQVLDGLVLKGDAGFELFDFLFELGKLGHGKFLLVA